MMQKPAITTAEVETICVSFEAILEFAELYPDIKDELMDAILAEPRIFSELRQKEGLQLASFSVFKLFKAYPTRAKAILLQFTENVVGTLAEKMYSLLKEASRDNFNYDEFLSFFPELKEELSNLILQDCRIYELNEVLVQLPHLSTKAIDKVLSQSDSDWLRSFDAEWHFLQFAELCPQGRDALFKRYFSVFFKGNESTFDKLLSIILKVDQYGRNTFGLKNLKILSTLFPEYKEAFLEHICNTPSALEKLLDEPDKKFKALIEFAPESKDKLLAALKKLPAYPGILGVLSHGVVDTTAKDHLWWSSEAIIFFYDNFPGLGDQFVKNIFTNPAALAKVLSHHSMKYTMAFDLALKFPQFKKEIVTVFVSGDNNTPQYIITESLVENAPERLRYILSVLAEAAKSDSDFEKGAMMMQLMGYPDLLNEAMEYLSKHAEVDVKNIYCGTPFPEELWPWLNLLLSGEVAFEKFHQLFPNYSFDLIKFSLTNELFRTVFLKNSDNIFWAMKFSAELAPDILSAIKSLEGFTSEEIEQLISIVPGQAPKIVEMLVSTYLDSYMYMDLVKFAHKHPDLSKVLIESLRNNKEVFLKILGSTNKIAPLLLLFPNRRLLVESLCQDKVMEKDKLVALDDTRTAFSVIPYFVKCFIPFLFEIPQYPRVFFGHFMFNQFRGLNGHEKDILLILCSFPDSVGRLKSIVDSDWASDIYTAELRALIGCCYNICKQVLDKSINVDTLVVEILKVKSSYRGTIVKLIDRIIEAISKKEDVEDLLSTLKQLRDRASDKAVPSLLFFASQKIKEEALANLPVDLTDKVEADRAEYR